MAMVALPGEGAESIIQRQADEAGDDGRGWREAKLSQHGHASAGERHKLCPVVSWPSLLTDLPS